MIHGVFYKLRQTCKQHIRTDEGKWTGENVSVHLNLVFALETLYLLDLMDR